MHWLIGSWAVFFSAFLVGHLRVRRSRGPNPAKENRVRRELSSNVGLLLQALAVCLLFGFREPVRPDRIPASMVIAGASIGLAFWAIIRLGRQWRVQAVVTDDHELVTSGPYAIVRHPIYLAFLGMSASWALAVSSPLIAACAIGLFVVGTEIRIRAEDRLLEESFHEAFAAYRRRVSAYIPGFR